MIKDYLVNAHLYSCLSENLKKGFDWLNTTNLKEISDGKYEIDGANVYASVQTYETKDSAKYESHKNYIDIQYMIEGCEKVGVTDLNNCSIYIEYDAERDLEFYNIDCEEEYVSLNEGQFLVLFPHDAHKPSMTKTCKTKVKKVVVKVAV